MPDFNVRADSVNVEQIMEQIRARIRETHGAEYTEEQIRELATVKLEKFLHARGVRADLVRQLGKSKAPQPLPELPNYSFEEQTLFASTRAPLAFIRRLLLPILKLFFNPNPLIRALHIQSRLNTIYGEREARREEAAHSLEQLHYEVLHNLVVEMTRMGLEVKDLKMRVESVASRLEFNERRARAFEAKPGHERGDRREGREGRELRESREQREPPEHREPREFPDARELREAAVEQPRPSAAPIEPSAAGMPAEGTGQRSRRRRRRRGRRGGGAAATSTGPSPSVQPTQRGEAQASSDASGGESPPDIDQRITPPEPFEPASGAQTRPSEPTVADSAQHSTAGSGGSAPQASDSPSDAPDDSHQ